MQFWNYLYGNTGSIKEILETLGDLSNKGFGSPLSFEKVKSNLAESKPFVIRWGWNSGGGHFVVGHGITGNNLYYMNPWFGEGYKIATYDWVLSGNNHNWTHSDTLTLIPAAPYLLNPENQASDVKLDTKFNWEKVNNANSYLIEVSKKYNFSEILSSKIVLQNTVNFANLDIDWDYEEAYYWRVKAKVNNSWSEYSKIYTFTTEAQTIEEWIKLSNFWKEKVDIITEEEIQIIWESKNIERFQIAYRTDKQSNNWFFVPWKEGNSCTWTVDKNNIESCQIVVSDLNNPLIADTSKTFKIDIESSIHEKNEEAYYKIIPNPATNSFIVQNMPIQTAYKITDLQGKLILKGNYEGQINISNYSPGMYLVVFDQYSLKLLIE